ncbi:MAG: outer membrane lipoprotein chaperone LolA [Ignavibacteria bacterium]|nr:outer membrane lipoprotein chaperone LolA [Ignavibacteria bacterium]
MIVFQLIAFLLPLFLTQISEDKILAEVQKKYSSIKYLKANLTQSMEITVGDKKKITEQTFNFVFKKDNKYRLESEKQLIVSDGKSIWNYNPFQKRVVITKAENNNLSLQYFLFQIPSESEVKFVGTEKVDGSEVYKLSFRAKEKNLNFKHFDVFITKNFLIKRIETYSPAQDRIAFSLSNINLNPNVNDSIFDFVIPAGVKVIDLR